MFWRNNTMTFLPLSNNCDKKIIKLYIPVNDISPNNIRASTIQLKLGGNNCCGFSNVVNIAIPPAPPPPPIPGPEVCIPDNLDLYGYTAIVSYDPVNCTAGHVCNRAIFDFYIDNTLIGRANLNNLDTGGYKESVFVINEHIITTGSTSIRLDKPKLIPMLLLSKKSSQEYFLSIQFRSFVFLALGNNGTTL